MAAPEHAWNEQELSVGRQAILRSLTYVRSQIAMLSDRVAFIEEQIRCREQELMALRQHHREAA